MILLPPWLLASTWLRLSVSKRRRIYKREERINTPQCISLQFVFLPALDGVAEEYNARIHRPLEDLDVE